MSKHRENTTRAEATAEAIIELIIDSKMQEGEKLPNEFELAKMLGVGRSTLREAIRRLVARNVLQVRQGSGTFVSSKHGVPEDPLGLTFLSDTSRQVLDLLDIRLMLEPEICSRTVYVASDEQIEKMREYCDICEALIESGQDYSEADANFHCYLAECSGNLVLRNLLPIITSAVPVVIAATSDKHRLQTINEHRLIVDAIERRDALGARCCMLSHLNTSRASVLKDKGKIL